MLQTVFGATSTKDHSQWKTSFHSRFIDLSRVESPRKNTDNRKMSNGKKRDAAVWITFTGDGFCRNARIWRWRMSFVGCWIDSSSLKFSHEPRGTRPGQFLKNDGSRLFTGDGFFTRQKFLTGISQERMRLLGFCWLLVTEEFENRETRGRRLLDFVHREWVIFRKKWARSNGYWGTLLLAEMGKLSREWVQSNVKKGSTGRKMSGKRI